MLREVAVAEQRYRAVLEVLDGATVVEVARRFGVSRQTVLVCFEQTIDMTRGEGRAFAQMLAVLSELESAAISARLASAKSHLIQAVRVASGPCPCRDCPE